MNDLTCPECEHELVDMYSEDNIILFNCYNCGAAWQATDLGMENEKIERYFFG